MVAGALPPESSFLLYLPDFCDRSGLAVAAMILYMSESSISKMDYLNSFEGDTALLNTQLFCYQAVSQFHLSGILH